eukprot:g747.t1
MQKKSSSTPHLQQLRDVKNRSNRGIHLLEDIIVSGRKEKKERNGSQKQENKARSIFSQDTLTKRGRPSTTSALHRLLERDDFQKFQKMSFVDLQFRRKIVEKKLKLHAIDPDCKDRFFQASSTKVSSTIQRKQAGRLTNFWRPLEKAHSAEELRSSGFTSIAENTTKTNFTKGVKGRKKSRNTLMMDRAKMESYRKDLMYSPTSPKHNGPLMPLDGWHFNYRSSLTRSRSSGKMRQNLSSISLKSERKREQPRKFGTTHRQDRAINYHDAEEKLQLVFLLRAKNCGIDHPSTFKVMNSLVKVYRAQEKEGSARHLLNDPQKHIERIQRLFETQQNIRTLGQVKKVGEKLLRKFSQQKGKAEKKETSATNQRIGAFRHAGHMVSNAVHFDRVVRVKAKMSKKAKSAKAAFKKRNFKDCARICIESIKSHNGDMDVYRLFVQSIARARQFPNWKDYCAEISLTSSKQSFVIGENLTFTYDYKNLAYLAHDGDTSKTGVMDNTGDTQRLHHALDWIGIMTDKEFHGDCQNILVRKTVPHQNIGEVTFEGGLPERGKYWAVYFVGDSYLRPAISTEIDRFSGAVSFQLNHVQVHLDVNPMFFCGDPVIVKYKLHYPEGILHHDDDYIGIYPVDIQGYAETAIPYKNGECIAKRKLLLDRNSGSITFDTHPSYPGRYELRMYTGASKKELTGTSDVFEVRMAFEKRASGDIERAMRRSLRVYLSFATGEQSDERDEFLEKVFPLLRRVCREKRVSLSFTDFHSGMKNSYLKAFTKFPQIFHEIEVCRPFFVSVITSRYGHIPHNIPTAVTTEHPWILQHKNKGLPEKCTNKFSIHELEIIYSQLIPRLQDDLATKSDKGADLVLSDFPAGSMTNAKYGYIQGRHISYIPMKKSNQALSLLDLDPLSSERACMSLKKLTTTVCEDLPMHVKITEFTNGVFDDMLAKIDHYFPNTTVPSFLDAQAISCDCVIHENCKSYSDSKGTIACRKLLLSYLGSSTAHVPDHGQVLCEKEFTPLIVLGKTGSGKTSFLSNVIMEYFY